MTSASGLSTSDLSTQLKQADQQIEQTLTIVRQTGKQDTLPASLEPIRLNLESLHGQLIASGQGADASFAILRAGDCLRILNRWSEALDHYHQAIEEGRQAKRLDVQARAWLGTERAERMGLRDYGAAGEAVRQANGLLTNQPDLWPIQADVWGEQSDLEVAQGEPLRALHTLGKVISLCTEHNDDGQQLAGYPRLGQGGKNMAVIAGMDSVDAAAVDTSGLGMGHQYYPDSRTILSDLYYFSQGEPPSKRFSLRRSANGQYWIFSP